MRPVLKLDEVRKALPFRVSQGLSMHYIKEWIAGTYNDHIDWDVYLPTKKKNLQRGFVWNKFQKEQLILSILKGVRIPPIIAIQYREHETGGQSRLERKTTYQIIDGKQRFSTILSFAKGEFSIEWEGYDYFINDLDEWGQRAILLMMPTFDVAYEYPDALISDDDKIAWFEMINFAGTPQDIEHLKHLKS